MTQSEQILNHLKSGHSITPLEALDKFGCMRLGARVYDLKQQGHDIRTEPLALPSGKHVARYWMEAA